MHAALRWRPPADAVDDMLAELLPHRITEYLYDLASECPAVLPHCTAHCTAQLYCVAE